MAAEKENMFEAYFEWWLNELQKVGLVKKFYKEPESIKVLDPIVLYTNVHHPKKDIMTTTHNILNPASYTRDYDVEFHKSLLDVFIGLIKRVDGNMYYLHEFRDREKGDTYFEFSYYYLLKPHETQADFFTVSFDVKPPSAVLQRSSKLGSSREFPYNQKLMLEKHDIFVNKVIPCKSRDSLFNKTFMPEKYLLTDAGKQLRKLNNKIEKVRTIKEWMAIMNLKPIV